MVEGIVQKTGYNALHLDYSGHGNDTYNWEEISAAQQFIEVINAFDWITDKTKEAKIVVFGTSFGGYLATQLTKYRRFDKLVLAAPAIYPADSFYEAAADTHNGGDGSVTKLRNDSDALISHPLIKRAASRFDNPVLVVVHENDEAIPATTTDAYIKAFGADKAIMHGLPHSTEEPDIENEVLDEYQSIIAEWLKK